MSLTGHDGKCRNIEIYIWIVVKIASYCHCRTHADCCFSVVFIRVPVSFRMQQSQSHHATPVSSQSGDVLVRLQPVSELHLHPAQDLHQPRTHGRAEKRQVHSGPSCCAQPLHQVAKQQLALIHIQLRSPLSDSNNWTVHEYKIMYVEGSVVHIVTVAHCMRTYFNLHRHIKFRSTFLN